MGFTSFLKHKKEDKWSNINSMEDLASINQASFVKPQIIFKHSTRCSISQVAKNRMIEGLDQIQDMADVHYLDLLSYRQVSNEIAIKWGVEHESPQVIIIKDGKAVFNCSHNMINVAELKKELNQLNG